MIECKHENVARKGNSDTEYVWECSDCGMGFVTKLFCDAEIERLQKDARSALYELELWYSWENLLREEFGAFHPGLNVRLNSTRDTIHKLQAALSGGEAE